MNLGQAIWGIALSVAATIICNGLVLIRIWRRRRAESNVRRFWCFKNDLVYIVRPAYVSPSGEKLENMARVEDILAIKELTRMLDRRRIRYKEVDHSVELPVEADIILVCSPKGNKRSAEFQRMLRSRYSFNLTIPSTPYFVDEATKVEYWSPRDRGGGDKDIGLLGRCTKSDTGQRVFLAWGIHGPGTLGVARCAVDRTQLDIINRHVGDRDFSVLIECEYTGVSDVRNPRVLVQPGELSWRDTPSAGERPELRGN